MSYLIYKYCYHIVYLADFLNTNLAKFAAIWLKKGQKARFLASDKLHNHTSKGNGREKLKEPGGEENRKKQYVVAPFVFILATGITLTEKKLVGGRGVFHGNVFKNQARYTHYNILIYIQICWLNTEMCFF